MLPSVKRTVQSTPTLFFLLLISQQSSPSTHQSFHSHRREVTFNLLFALNEAAAWAAAHGGVRAEVGAFYPTALNSEPGSTPHSTSERVSPRDVAVGIGFGVEVLAAVT
jgi:hypothetical protein